MKELVIENLHKTYGIKTLLNGINYSVRTGDRIGLIGPNGTGKSSLLKVIVGLDTYDQGSIKTPNEYSIAYLDQHPVFDANLSILDVIYKGDSPEIKLALEYARILDQLNTDPHNHKIQKRFNDLTDEMNHKNGWELDVKVKTILSQLGISDLNRQIEGLSGGELKRIGLAQVLISEPDLLILDEPTNHLDIQSIRWLEKYLSSYKGALLLVTHDRYFLERVVNKIVELRHGNLTEYQGNYQEYLRKRSEQAQIMNKMLDKQDKLFKEELAWMRKGAKARTTKQQARIDRFDDLSKSIQSRHQEEDTISFEFDQQRIGNRIIDIENITLSIFGKSILKGYSKTFIKGDRIGIIGENGVGKTSLLNAIAGILVPDEGTIHLGQTVKIAYYRQMDQDLPSNMRILEYLSQVADNFKRPDGSVVSAASMLERFNFPREGHGAYISQLSGGERRRLYLLTLLIQEPNVILLDEPTNDLDIDTLTVLEDYLLNFEGVVIIVSHDRYFLDKLVDQVLIIKGQGSYDEFYGNYSEYLEFLDSEQASVEKEITNKSSDQFLETNKPQKNKLSYLEKKEWAELEDKIESSEMKIEQLQESMNKYGDDLGKLLDLQKEIDAENDQLLYLYERYDYLSEKE